MQQTPPIRQDEISATEALEFQNVYSPGTLLGVYAAAVRSNVEGKLVLARGVFQVSPNSRNYGDFFYDSIKSVYENKSVKAKIPALLRNKLEHNHVYLFKGYIEKKIAFSAIELQFVVDEVLQKEENQVSEEDVKRFRLIQQKITKGYRDLEALVRDHVFRNEPVHIANIYGKMAIVHKDFEKGLGDVASKFRFTDIRCNITSKSEIIQCLNALSGTDVQAVALIRGGGDPSSLEVFNDPEIGAATLKLQPLFVTALGHTVNETLADKLADKKFALPHDYGNSLKVWVEDALAEQARSKSVFIDQVKADLTKTFHDQIKALQSQLETRNKEFSSQEVKFKELIEQNQKDKAESLQAKEAAFKAQTEALIEQIRAKEQALKTLQEQNEKSAAHQVNAATIELKTRYELLDEKFRELNKQTRYLKPGMLLLYLALAIAAGVFIGILGR